MHALFYKKERKDVVQQREVLKHIFAQDEFAFHFEILRKHIAYINVLQLASFSCSSYVSTEFIVLYLLKLCYVLHGAFVFFTLRTSMEQ